MMKFRKIIIPAAVCIMVLIGIGVFFPKNNRQNQTDRQDLQTGQEKTGSERETAQTETLNEDKESNSLPNTENNVYDKKIVESSYLWRDAFLSGDDALDKESPNYTFLVDAVSANDIIQVTELVMPETINGYAYGTMGWILDRNLCIVQLASEREEIGAWNYMTNEYEDLFSAKILDEDADVEPESRFGFNDSKDGKLLLLSSGIGMVNASLGAVLWLYDFETNEIKKIYTYNRAKDNPYNYLYPQNFVMTEEGIYFEDSFRTDVGAGFYSKILFYDYDRQEVVTERNFGVNPIKYKDSYACFTGDITTTRYNTLIDRNGNVLWEVDEYGCDIAGNGEDIFITAQANNDEKMVTRFGIRTLGGRYILTTYRVCRINSVTPRAVLVRTDCLNEDYPFLYDIGMDKILRFDSIPCTNFYFMQASSDGSRMILGADNFKKVYLLEYK